MAWRPRVTCLEEIRAQPVRWLWPGRIPLGKLTLIGGDPCLGKSVLTTDLAARVTIGGGWPDAPEQRHERGQVLIMSAEDDPADTIRPRFEAAAGDVRACHLMTTMIGDDGKRVPVQLGDIDVLEEAVREISNLKLIIIDPVSAFCGNTDSHNNTGVRGLLAPLAELAGRYGVSVVCVTHLSKGSGGKSLYRFSGSLAFAAAARAAWLVMADPAGTTPGRVLMLPGKVNPGPSPTGMAYRIVGQDFAGVGSQPVMMWESQPVLLTADGALKQEAISQAGQGPSASAAEWLRGLLEGGDVAASEVEAEARAAGHSWPMLRRLKDELGIRSVRVGFGSSGVWVWRLPGRGGESCIEVGNPIDAQGPPMSAFGGERAPSVNGHGNGVEPDALWERFGGDDSDFSLGEPL